MNIGTLGGSWAASMTYSQPLVRMDRTGSDMGRAVLGVQSVSATPRVASTEEHWAAERTPWVNRTEETTLEKNTQRTQEEQKAERAAQEKERAEKAKLPPLEGLTLEEVRIILGTLPVAAGYQEREQNASATLDVKI
ncbi:MAG: hypothetical protein QG608_6 [Actinomycetota bacterium]|nr:hypothetical protein [Actinomycetota bacterium]